MQEDLLIELEKVFNKSLNANESWSLAVDPADNDGQTILFFYPRCNLPISDYVRPAVKIEVGARADHLPVSIKNVSPYVVQAIPNAFKIKNLNVRVLNAERTFWEKATILHMYANYPEDKQVPERQSRHFYDFYCLLNSDISKSAVADLDLLEKVKNHKSLYFNSAWANYETAKKGSLKIIPSQRVLDAMEKDYKAMNEMFFDEIPEWETIINLLQEFENKFNTFSEFNSF